MRILAISDIHGAFETPRRLLDDIQPDILLCTGDWGDPGEVSEESIAFFTSRSLVLSIYGNHDDRPLLSRVRNDDGTPVLLEQGELREIRGLNIAGISGIWAKSHRQPWYVTDDDVAGIAASLNGNRIDILLTHGCPAGLADLTPAGTHGGQWCFTNVNRVLKPQVHLCGHLHRKSFRQLTDSRLSANVGYSAQGDYLVMEGDIGIPLNQWGFIQGTMKKP